MQRPKFLIKAHNKVSSKANNVFLVVSLISKKKILSVVVIL